MAQAKDIARIQTTLLLKKGWHYVRYRHLREALKLIDKNSTVLGINIGAGLAEVALAMEFPRMTFLATDPASESNVAAAQEAMARYEVGNIEFGQFDLARPGTLRRTFGLVYSLEVLTAFPDPERAAAAIRGLTENYVMTLVALGDNKPAAPQPSWMRASQPAGNGMSLTQLLEMFPNPVAIHGAYWADAGVKLREKLANLSNNEIKAQAEELKTEAEADFRSRLPVKKSQALALWTLALPNGV